MVKGMPNISVKSAMRNAGPNAACRQSRRGSATRNPTMKREKKSADKITAGQFPYHGR